MWRFPLRGTIGLVLGRRLSEGSAGLEGVAFCLFPEYAGGRPSKLRFLREVLRLHDGAELFATKVRNHLVRVSLDLGANRLAGELK